MEIVEPTSAPVMAALMPMDEIALPDEVRFRTSRVALSLTRRNNVIDTLTQVYTSRVSRVAQA